LTKWTLFPQIRQLFVTKIDHLQQKTVTKRSQKGGKIHNFAIGAGSFLMFFGRFNIFGFWWSCSFAKMCAFPVVKSLINIRVGLGNLIAV
jgi:hypothetical protein